MTGRHYNWHKRWTLDPAAATATHETGWVVRFVTAEQAADMPPTEIGGDCWIGERRWIALHQGGDDALRRWLQEQSAHGLRDPNSIRKRIARLMREAGELWARHKANEGKQ